MEYVNTSFQTFNSLVAVKFNDKSKEIISFQF